MEGRVVGSSRMAGGGSPLCEVEARWEGRPDVDPYANQAKTS